MGNRVCLFDFFCFFFLPIVLGKKTLGKTYLKGNSLNMQFEEGFKSLIETLNNPSPQDYVHGFLIKLNGNRAGHA